MSNMIAQNGVIFLTILRFFKAINDLKSYILFYLFIWDGSHNMANIMFACFNVVIHKGLLMDRQLQQKMTYGNIARH